MKRFACLVMIALFYGCSHEPVAIEYGRDVCTTCKMILMDERFGAEIVSNKGKVFKFDDVNCMIQFLNSQSLKENEIKHKLVVDYQQKDHFLDADKAAYVVSEEIRSPMRGNAGAVKDRQEALNLQNEKQGAILDWNQLYDKLK